jgi:hypothetical protein
MLFRVCYQNYFNHKFRSQIGLLCKLPRGFCLWKFSFNTLIACTLPLRSSSHIKLKFLECFFSRSFAFLFIHKKKQEHRRLILCTKAQTEASINFLAYTLITWWKEENLFQFHRTREISLSTHKLNLAFFVASAVRDGEGENIQIKCFSPTPTP